MSAPVVKSAASMGLVACHGCGLVCQQPAVGEDAHCPRCGTHLQQRRPHSLAYTWALLLTAMILYIPANVLPIMRTGQLFSQAQDNTIISGVVELWHSGAGDLAVIVFVASILVPMLKFFALIVLLVGVHRGKKNGNVHHARLYRLIEHIGYWSMLDVFVVTLLVALVQFGSLALVQPRPGVIFFGLVVVLTMLASMSFDPRLIWDREQQSRRTSQGKHHD